MKGKKFKVPHTYVLLFIIIIISAVLTYVIPAGSFERVKDEVTGKTVIVAESFQYVDSTPVDVFGIFKSIPKGLKASAGIVFFIFVIGGAFGIIQGTGFIEAALGKAVKTLKGKEKLLFPLLIFAFSVGGATFGLAEETLPFIPILIALCRGLGYDTMLGLALVSVGARVGFVTGMMNPFTVGVAQGIAEIPLFSGLGYRTIWYVLILVVTVMYCNWYANKIKNDPTKGVMYDLEQLDEYSSSKLDMSNIPDYTSKHNIVFVVLIAGFSILLYGVFKLGWYITEISAIFLAIGIIAGIAGGLGANDIANKFVVGAKDLTFGALVVGVARGILVVLQDGQIIDTIIYSAATWLRTLPTAVAANGMYVFQLLLNILIPSGSGQAAATMPVMVPISDMVGVTRQTAVLAYHYGDGFTNLISPTNGTLMASLAIANVPYDRWAKWMWPLLAVWMIIGMVAVTIAAIIGYGPM